MSLMITKEIDIVDREPEVNQILDFLGRTDEDGESHLIALCADTGYGKSSIMVKASVADKPVAKRIVIVDTPPANCNMVQIEGAYLHYIADAINKKTDYHLDDFLYSSDSRYKSLIDTDAILMNGLSGRSALLAKMDCLISTDLSSQRMLFDSSADSILILKDYIRSAIFRKNIILDITNSQNIDAVSYRILRDLIQSSLNSKFVMEYTTAEGAEDSAIQFFQGFSCKFTLMKIDKLPFEFALTIMGVPKRLDEIQKAEQFYTDIVCGNLYKIAQAKMDAKNTSINYGNDPISEKIKHLKFAPKIFLGVLCLHDGEISTQVFNEFIASIDDIVFSSTNCLEELDTLAASDGKSLWLRHASIIDCFSLTPDNAAALTAYKYLVEFYSSRISDSDIGVRNQAVVQLVKLHSRFDPERTIPLLEQFKNVIINMLSETAAFSLISQVFNVLNANETTYYHLTLINLCYDAGLYPGALELLERIDYSTTYSGQVLMCMLLNRNDQHDRAIKLCKKVIKTVTDQRYKLIILMIQMLSERSLNREKEYIATFRLIENSKEFQSLFEYGFFLRNAQIVKPYLESLNYLRQSIMFFEENRDSICAAHSQLTYLIQRARLGHLDESAKELDELSCKLLQTSFEKHIVYSNQAAIRILSGQADDETDFLLEKALLTATTVFDRIVILNNMLCALIIREGSLDEFSELEEKLNLELFNEPDEKLRLKTYTNFFLYHKYISKDAKVAKRWHIRACIAADKVKTKNQTIERIFLYGESPTKDFEFLVTQHLCISFITYWHFKIPLLDALERSCTASQTSEHNRIHSLEKPD